MGTVLALVPRGDVRAAASRVQSRPSAFACRDESMILTRVPSEWRRQPISHLRLFVRSPVVRRLNDLVKASLDSSPREPNKSN